jgi:hypothetical protein
MRHSDHLAESSEEQHPFRNDRVSRASLISEFLVATANLIHPVCISTVWILKAEHNVDSGVESMWIPLGISSAERTEVDQPILY